MFCSKLYSLFQWNFFYWRIKEICFLLLPFMLNMVNVCRCFSSSSSNQLITSVVFFDLFCFSFSHKPILILSNKIFPILFLVGFISLVVVWLTKFPLCSFKVMKQLLKLLVSILSNTSARFAYVIHFCV